MPREPFIIFSILADKKIIERVKTDRDIMRYDGNTPDHHHLYCMGTDDILDYSDEELDRWLAGYFSGKQFEGFSIENIRYSLQGKGSNLVEFR